jgi:ketosteroid isomerase-like protein
VSEPTNREIVDRFVKALFSGDFDTQDQFLAEGVIEDFPQSGERIRGKANRRAIGENYPGRAEREFAPGTSGTVVGDDRWILTPAMSLVRVTGSGDRFVVTSELRYPNGELWQLVQLIDFHAGTIVKLTSYFAAPFEAPAWRAKWVDSIPPAE